MAITIDHLVLPARDNEASARFFAEVMGREYAGPDRHFAPVRVSETFTLTYMNVQEFSVVHFAFHIEEADFDSILARLRARGVSYGNDPRDPTNLRTDHPFGGRGFFFLDPNGHLLEVMTKVHPS
jgi:catechol 2,3-dioxygenase-like lactoylglutathione lyase family enzyme